MVILGIESSCDETAAAVCRKNKQGEIEVLSHSLATSLVLQSNFGGVIPEQAAREQLKSIIPVIKKSLKEANLKLEDIDAIAVTVGPGLIGSLLVGVETAKSLACSLGKPLIKVNHLLAHFYALWATVQPSAPIKSGKTDSSPSFPFLGLLVSGSHTDLLLFKSHSEYTHLGGTRDDAAGECFDKCARLLGLTYPGGAKLSKLAESGNPKAYPLPKSMTEKNLEFSFSGLKTAVANLISNQPINKLTNQQFSDLAASIQEAIVEQIVRKTVLAIQSHNISRVAIAGGVAANSHLRSTLQKQLQTYNIQLFTPPVDLCTDNAITTTVRAFFETPIKDPLLAQANPNLSL